MSGWGEVFLGVIALSTLLTAILQIALLVAAGRLARRMERMVETFDQELRPALGHVNAIARDAARAVSLATAQVERVDRLLTDLGDGIEQAIAVVRSLVGGPVRQGRAVSAAMSAFWAVWSAIRDGKGTRGTRRADEEDALFI